MDRTDGGPAFPHMAEAMYQGHGGLVTKQITNNGMSLRDYFAAKVLQGFVTSGHDLTSAHWMIPQAYALADKMLKERDPSI